MDGKHVQHLLSRALSDEAFKQMLLADPESTARAAGFQLTLAEVEALNSLGPGLSVEELEHHISSGTLLPWMHPAEK